MKRTIISPEAEMRSKKDEKSGTDELSKAKEAAIEKPDARSHQAKVLRSDLRNGLNGNYITMADRVAQSTIYHKNYKIPDAEKHYPIDILSRFVDKYFPYAKGGPLYVDEPVTEREMLKAHEKQALLKSLGLRSVVILMKREAFKNLETAYYDCLEQLGEI